MKKVLLGLILISPIYHAHGAANDPFATPPRRLGSPQHAPGAPVRVAEGGYPPMHGGFSLPFPPLTLPASVLGTATATPPGGEPL